MRTIICSNPEIRVDFEEGVGPRAVLVNGHCVWPPVCSTSTEPEVEMLRSHNAALRKRLQERGDELAAAARDRDRAEDRVRHLTAALHDQHVEWEEGHGLAAADDGGVLPRHDAGPLDDEAASGEVEAALNIARNNLGFKWSRSAEGTAAIYLVKAVAALAKRVEALGGAA